MAQAEEIYRTTKIPCGVCRKDPPQAGWFGVEPSTGKLIPVCNAYRHHAASLSAPFREMLTFQRGVGAWIVQEVMES